MATLSELQRALELAQFELQNLNAQSQTLAQEYYQAGSPTSGPIYDKVVANSLARREVAFRIEELIAQISQLNAGGTSAGNIVQNDDQATVDNARTQAPNSPPELLENGRVKPPPDTTSGSNAITFVPDAQDFGTDGQLRPGIITQGTPAQIAGTNSTGPIRLDPTLDGRDGPADAVPGGNPGVVASNEDVGRATATRAEIDAIFQDEKIVPLANVLDQYSSYTYVASIYLQTVEAVGRMVRTGKKDISGSQLLVQSGGAPVGGRNPYFSNDYYIENITLDSRIAGKGSGWSHNVQNARITIVEPNGISFLDNVAAAVNSFLGPINQGVAKGKERNYQAENYLLVIKFYGYDQNGNLVRGGVSNPDGSSDPNAFVEKWYPLRINNIKFKVSSKLVEYNIEATVSQYDIASGTAYATIPYNVELGGKSVREMLAGSADVYTSSVDQITQAQQARDNFAATDPRRTDIQTVLSAPQNALSAPSKSQTLRQGLMAAMNQYELEFVRKGEKEYPNIYAVEFPNGSSIIADAKVSHGSPIALVTASTCMPTSTKPTDQIDSKRQSMDIKSRNQAITAGQQLVSVIDQIIRNSSYILEQATSLPNEKTGALEPNGTPGKNLAWFKTSFSAVPYAMDSKRNDYAYKITYTITPYRINNAPKPWFTPPGFKGVHKRYDYWFTGQNTAVLSYEEEYKSQYSLILSGGYNNALAVDTSNANDLQRYMPAPRSNESSQQARGIVNEVSANLADYLYNPQDLALANVTIVGDPAWLQQGEAFFGGLTVGKDIYQGQKFFSSAFLPDGTINFESQEILFEIAFNKPVDYDLNTGLLDPGQNNYNADRANNQAGLAVQSRIYLATRVISEFNKGKFTQKLQGRLRRFPQSQALSDAYKAAEQTRQNTVSGTGIRTTTLLPGAIGPVLSSPPTPPNLPTSIPQAVTGLLNAATNVLGGTLSKVINQTTVPPTSSGQPVGTVNNTEIDSTTGQPISANERVVGLDSTVQGNSQTAAPGDDSGVEESISNYSVDYNTFDT